MTATDLFWIVPLAFLAAAFVGAWLEWHSR
jgi:hypothetical protein